MLRPKSANIFRFFENKLNYTDSTQKNFYVMIANFENCNEYYAETKWWLRHGNRYITAHYGVITGWK